MIYKFLPIFKSTIWGGTSIAPFKGAVAAQTQIGESWEISGVKDCESIVAEGPEAGLTLSELIKAHGESLLGRKVVKRYGTDFPLLVKFIDARQDLSVQVHPNDQQAAARHNGSRGKTEMWYVVNASSDARLYAGFKRRMSAEEYWKSVEDNTIIDVLAEYNVKPGDMFFLPAGCVHSIGAGCLIAEIQETSDITYRIYDFNRRDKDGNLRQLHTELAKDVIDYRPFPGAYVDYDRKLNTSVDLISCEHFTTHLYDLTERTNVGLLPRESFTIIMCLDGGGELVDPDGISMRISRGTTLLVSASVRNLIAVPDSKMKLLTASI